MTPALLESFPHFDPEVRLQPPAIERWRRGPGTDVEFVHVLESGRPGPTAMVVALTHGNELCGAIALDTLLGQGVAPLRGRLILAFANVEAFGRFNALEPFSSRCVDEDMNRIWDDAVLRGARDSVELRRARELAPFVDAADVLLDLHSMQEAGAPALTICGMTDKSVPLARALGQPETLLVDTGHAAGLRMIDRGGFADPRSPRQAVLVECGAHWEPASATMATDVTLRFLAHLGLVEPPPGAAVKAPARRFRLLEVHMVKTESFAFARPVLGFEVFRKGELIATDAGQEIRSPCDDCTIFMPTRAPLVGREGVYLTVPV